MFLAAPCVVCGETVGRRALCAGCGAALTARPTEVADGTARVRWRLTPDVRELLASVKYQRQRHLARWLAEQVAPLVPLGADILTWVPASPSRVSSRGHDHAEEVARSLGRLTGVPVKSLLRRQRTDRRQTDASLADRQRGPALTSTARVDGLVVVVDDITTTGASLARAGEALGQAGATRLMTLALARTARYAPWQREPAACRRKSD